MRVLRDVQGPSTRNRPLITNVDDAIRGDVRPTARAALVAAVLVLIIACANVANLLSAHVLANRRDYATQLALGAPRRRVIRRVLLEALCVAVCAAAVGLWLAWAGVRTFGMVASGLFPRVTDVGLGPQVLGAIVGLTIVAALFSGIVPALTAVRAEGAIGASLTAFPTLGRARGAMIACQVALTLPLLFGAGLLARTVTVLLRTDPGFDATHGVAAKLVISDNSLVHGADHSAAFESMLTRLRAFPTVRAAGVGTVLPPRKTLVTIGIRYIGEGRNEFRFFKLGSGTPGFLSALGARFLRGRDFTDQDVQVAAGVAVISESAARHLFGDRDPIGERINRLPPLAGAPQPTVVGVVSDIKFDGLDAPVAGAVYVPWTQLATGTTYVVVRGHEDPMQLVPTIRQILRSSWPHAAIPEIVSLNQAMSESVAIRQLRSGPAVMLALVAVLITFAGVLGTFHRVALERRRELAIRRALGATSQDLLPLFVRAGAMIVGGGVAVGVVLAVAIGQCLASQLYGVESNDPALLAASAAVLVATACLGFYLPFRRVLRLNPSTELQCE
jgi:putative ABC transport system permease protein